MTHCDTLNLYCLVCRGQCCQMHVGYRERLSKMPSVAGLTKMVSRLGKEGSWRKALELYQSLPNTGVFPDTAITNAAISACDKGIFPPLTTSLLWSLPSHMHLYCTVLPSTTCPFALMKGVHDVLLPKCRHNSCQDMSKAAGAQTWGLQVYICPMITASQHFFGA